MGDFVNKNAAKKSTKDDLKIADILMIIDVIALVFYCNMCRSG